MATDEPQATGSGEPRKKRAKIVSACGECRRRKTKCNGELPCRSCHKADVPCVYPAVSHAEDKRNHLSKAALEAIEDRLKAIEDMLHTILQSQSFVAELPTAAVDQFLNNKVSSSPPTSNAIIVPPPPPPQSYIHQQLAQEHQTNIASSFVALPPPPSSSTTQQPQPPLSVHSPQQQYQKSKITTTTTTTTNTTTSPDVRLPSIHDLSAHSVYSSPPPLTKIKQEETDTTTDTTADLPPPLGYTSYYAAHNTGRTTADIPSDLPITTGLEHSLSAAIKKRKRSP